MNPQSFTFPPPPPAPPAVAQNYPPYTHTGGGQRGYGSNRYRGDRNNRGHGRGNTRGSSRGAGNFGSARATSGYSGYPLADNNPPFQSNAGYAVQASGQGRGGYALPDYPPVQLPQYPANLGQEYVSSPSTFAPSPAPPRPHQAVYPNNRQHPAHQHSGRQQYDPHRFGSPAPNKQSNPYPSQNLAPFHPRPHAHSPQPVLMGPPIRMGFNEQQEDQQARQYPQPAVTNSADPYQNGTYNSSNPAYSPNPAINDQSAHHNAANPFLGHRGRGHKRRHGEAFAKPRNHNIKGQAGPAVPSFGAPLPLPVKPPVPQDNIRKSKKKKRKHNQLGLTPRTEEHESSEEEDDDADEEARLASAVAGSGQGSQVLQFEYRGRTSTLQSSSDITAWIEERKKRYPTKARIAEVTEQKRLRQEAQKAAAIERREAQERQRLEANERKKKDLEAEQEQRRQVKKPIEGSEEAAAKAKRKIEKLRKQLEREERRAAKAEAKASKDKLRVDTKEQNPRSGQTESAEAHDNNPCAASIEQSLPTDAIDDSTVKAEPLVEAKPTSSESAAHDFALTTSQEKAQETVSTVPDPLTPTSQPPALDEDAARSLPNPEPDSAPSEAAHSKTLDNAEGDESLVSLLDKTSPESSRAMSDSTSNISSTDSEDLTSSSGSSSSDSDSDNNGPDQASSRRQGPEKVPPPPRAKTKQICRGFLKSGRCRRGENCRFLHELPERGSQARRKKETSRREGKTERVGLYQRLVEQEKEKEDHEVLKAIIHLGEGGHLDEDTSKDHGE